MYYVLTNSTSVAQTKATTHDGEDKCPWTTDVLSLVFFYHHNYAGCDNDYDYLGKAIFFTITIITNTAVVIMIVIILAKPVFFTITIITITEL